MEAVKGNRDMLKRDEAAVMGRKEALKSDEDDLKGDEVIKGDVEVLVGH